ncbi:MAG: hypothetical protein ACP5HU_10510 [Phycisphaerae bacterium]
MRLHVKALLALVAVAGLFVCAPAGAAIIAQESFESYAVGSLSEQGSAGGGWAGGWNANSSEVVDVSSSPLSANGVTGGDKAVLIGWGNENGRRLLTDSYSISGDTPLYISYLLRSTSDSPKGWIFNTTSNWDHRYVGVEEQSGAGDYIISSSYKNKTLGGPELDNGGTVMVVAKITDASMDLWVNPVGEGTPDLHRDAGWSSLPGIGLSRRGGVSG